MEQLANRLHPRFSPARLLALPSEIRIPHHADYTAILKAKVGALVKGTAANAAYKTPVAFSSFRVGTVPGVGCWKATVLTRRKLCALIGRRVHRADRARRARHLLNEEVRIANLHLKGGKGPR